MNLRLSKYTYLFESEKGNKLLYSTKGNSFLECDSDLYEALLKMKHGNFKDASQMLSLEVIEQLKDLEIICSEEKDVEFVEQIKFISQSAQHSTRKLGIVIAPTLGCNFACPYCFERQKRSGVMSEEVQDRLVQFIVESSNGNPISLYWYGGEALLGIDAIHNILMQLRGKVELENHILITNGFLLEPSIYSVFDDSIPLSEIQVTLDGTKARHNRLRALKQDRSVSTYDIICKNIEDFAVQHPKCWIHVRVNIDKTNYQDFGLIKEYMKAININGNINVYAGMIRLENSAMTKSIEPAFSRWEIADFSYKSAKKSSRSHELFPKIVYAKGCMANRVNSFIVGPSGEIYKCWNDVSDPSKVVGNIFSDKIINSQLYYRYHSSCAWHNDPECVECFYMPICNGKCAWYQMRNKFYEGEFNLCQCVLKAPGLINRILEDYYDYITTHKNDEDQEEYNSAFSPMSPA